MLQALSGYVLVGSKVNSVWHIMPFYFKKGKNFTQHIKKICAVNGEDTVTG